MESLGKELVGSPSYTDDDEDFHALLGGTSLLDDGEIALPGETSLACKLPVLEDTVSTQEVIPDEDVSGAAECLHQATQQDLPDRRMGDGMSFDDKAAKGVGGSQQSGTPVQLARQSTEDALGPAKQRFGISR